jgi:hypothetical protein
MQISSVNSQKSYCLESKVSNNEQKFNIKDIIENSKVEDNKEGDQDIWNKLSKEYDVTNMSFNDLETVCKKLNDSGQGSLELNSLLLVPKLIAQIQARKGCKIDPLLTLENAGANWKEKKINLLEEFQARAEEQKKFENMFGYNKYKERINILKNLL